MQIQGINFECNMSDTRKIKAYELTRKKILESQEDSEIAKSMMYEQLELYCSHIVGLVNELVGEEICKQLISNPNDFLLCVEVFKQLTEVVNEEMKEIQNKLLKYDISRIQ